MTGRPGGLVFVLSGPSGVGKDSVLHELRALEPSIHYYITATTRSPRPGERDGIEYFFLPEDEFARLKATGGLLESAEAHGHHYGSPCRQVVTALEAGRDVLACVDVQGAMAIRSRIPSAILIFLAPESEEQLASRLRGRGTEAAADFELRLANAQGEIAQSGAFDYLVYNRDDRLEDAVGEVRTVITAERLRTAPRYAVLEGGCGG